MQIELAKCTLRHWKSSDLDSLIQHANNRKIWLNLRDRFPYPYSREAAEQWVQIAHTDERSVNFAIEVDGAAVGGIGLILGDDIDRRSAEIGYWLGEEFWGRGIISEAVNATTEFAFANFDLCRIWASVFDRNPASMRVLEKAGFVREGILRKSATKNGATLDTVLYALIRE